MDGGWLKLYRSIVKKTIWKLSTPEQKSILITLLCMVNHGIEEWEWRGKKYICQPGQKITSLDKIAKEAGKGISIQNVRTALERFEKLGFLTNQSTNESRLVTVLNWELYQSEGEELTKRLTDGSQRGNKGVTTNKNDKNDKNDKKIKIYSDFFENVYKIYPRPQSKDDTYKNWNKLLKTFTVEQLTIFTQNYVDYVNSMPEEDRQYAYGSNNFFGAKAYYKEFMEPKTWIGKSGTKPKQDKPPIGANFEQRTYDADYYNKIYDAQEK